MRQPRFKQPMFKPAIAFVILVFMGAIPVNLILPISIAIVALDLALPWKEIDE
jgi:hypothetical protein